MSAEQLSLFDSIPKDPKRSAEAERPNKPQDAGADRPAELAYPPVRTFPLAFGRALADEDAVAFVRSAHKIRLPAGRWNSVPKWTDLRKREVERILAEEGERAFEDLRRSTGGKDARGKLLKRRFRADGTEIVELTAEAERALKLQVGLTTGFRYLDPRTGQEYFTRLFRANRGYIESGLSWLGIAGPWFEEWREENSRRAEELQRRLSLDDLDPEELAQVDRFIRRAQILDDGQKVMEMILGQIGRQAQNPIRIPAVVFRVLLGIESDRNWKFHVEGALSALTACSFRLDSHGMQKIKAYGSFLGEWRYHGAGPGSHGNGVYSLLVLPGFLGCLAAFESGKQRLESGLEIVRYQFGRKPTKEARKALGWGSRKARGEHQPVPTFSGFDAGRPFFLAAESFSPARCALMSLIEREITLRKDAAGKGRKHLRAKPNAPDANDPRLYGQEFCPLLPKGKLFQGALGHFRRNPEAGRTLWGSRARSPEASDPRHGSLFSIMGYDVPAGVHLRVLKRVANEALEDIRGVVAYVDGVVAARGPEGRWLSLEDATKLHALDLAQHVKWFFFLPANWREIRMRKWEARMRERAARGEAPCAWKATVDSAEAARAQESARTEATGDGRALTDLDPASLRQRLRAARLERGLRLADVGKMFGVTKMTVSRWENGPVPDKHGKVRGKPIPRSMVTLMERWIATGQAPAPHELASRKNTRAGGRQDAL